MAARRLSRELNGHPTDIVVQTFADRILILVTQLQKVGTLIQASIPDTTPLPPQSDPRQGLPEPPVAIKLTPLFGSAPSEHIQTLHSLYASQIATLVWSHNALGTRRSVVIGLALHKSKEANDTELTESEKDEFREVMTMIYDITREQ